jgi:hypothetical protein
MSDASAGFLDRYGALFEKIIATRAAAFPLQPARQASPASAALPAKPMKE